MMPQRTQNQETEFVFMDGVTPFQNTVIESRAMRNAMKRLMAILMMDIFALKIQMEAMAYVR